MVNQLRDNTNNLPTVDYSNLLAQIIETLRATPKPYFKIIETNVENKSYKRFILDIDEIATTVSQKLISDPLSRSHDHKITTLNFAEECQKQFPQHIKEIQKLLTKLLQDAVDQYLQSSGKSSLSTQDFIKQLIVDLSKFERKQVSPNFNYPFSTLNQLQKHRLTLNHDQFNLDKHLRFHKLTICVKYGTNFDQDVKEGIFNYLNQNFENYSSRDQEELEDIVEELYNKRGENSNDFAKLKKIINQETLGKLKRKTQIIYLQFLLDQYYQNSKENHEEGEIYLKTLIRRLQYIDEFINLDHYTDGDYEIKYLNKTINYRDIFAREDAFKELPVIPLITGNLGEFRLDGAIEFTLGLKLKLNGDVNTSEGESSFEYHLSLLNPSSELHKKTLKEPFGVQKILKIALLYFFVFACDNPAKQDYELAQDLSYNPIGKFESKILPAFRKSEADLSTMLEKICKGFDEYRVSNKINKLVDFLKKIIKYKSLAEPQKNPVYLTLKQRLLKDNYQSIVDDNTMFDRTLLDKPKLALKYINVTDAQAQNNTFLSIPVTIAISDLQYFLTEDNQQFTMQYDIEQVKILPIIFIAKNHPVSTKYYENQFNERNCLVLPHQQAKPSTRENFFYNFAFSLLTFTTLNILLKKERLFLPILRLDIEKGDDTGLRESFMYNFSKVLAHLLNEQHRSNAQGIDIRSSNPNKISNAMSSLYSVLPKTFTLPQSTQLDKLAIIIVSSREHDRSWKPDIQQKYSTLMGEVVGILRKKNGTVKYRLLQTFSENYDRETLFKQPIVMSDVIERLYRQGYRHIIYIAKAPYTSTLHLTQNQDDEDLFFMSKDIIKLLKGEYKNLNIYPMFFDKYYVVPFKPLAQSLYIEDTSELTGLAEDQNKMFAVFFNLFNGQAVGTKNRTYRGVISYSTLLNFYDGILGDQKIRQGLIDEGNLKQDILQYLTLFHFARCEKASKNIHLKLDPYQNLIGDKSVGKLALLPHTKEKVEFNLLAFLTRVRAILNTQEKH